LWALTAYPLQVYVRENSIVYFNSRHKPHSRCGLLPDRHWPTLFFSMIRFMVIFGAANLGAANLAILLFVMEVRRCAHLSRSGLPALRSLA
jgi:hypothetical protein